MDAVDNKLQKFAAS